MTIQKFDANGEVAETINEDAPSFDPPQITYSLEKWVPWDRMTENEASLVLGALTDAQAKFKGTYDAAMRLTSGTTLFDDFKTLIAGVLTEERAAEILAMG
jgi:hypothetical protein